MITNQIFTKKNIYYTISFIILIIFIVFINLNSVASKESDNVILQEGDSYQPYMPDHIKSRIIPPNYNHYWNTEYQFSLFHKKSFVVKEYVEDNRSITIVFQDQESGQGFQIYITPYFEDNITEEQFLKDIPSGVKNNEQKTFIDGVEAVAFRSEDSILGETIELWFIKYGLLYEITAESGMESLIKEIVSSWRFY